MKGLLELSLIGFVSVSYLIRCRALKKKAVGFIFDLDGTLLDFEMASHEALNIPLKRFGKDVTWELHASIIGKPHTAWSVEILNALGIPQHIYPPTQYAKDWHSCVMKSFPDMQLLPGALELVARLKQKFPQSKLAIATSSERINFDVKMSYHPALLSFFDAIVTGDEIIRGKPSPDIFLEAAKRIKVHPKRCVVFEDSPSGAIGGKAAGSFVIAVPDERLSAPKAAFGKTDLTIKSLIELTDEILDDVYQKIAIF